MKRSEVKGGPSTAAKVSRTEETENGSGDAKTVENTVVTNVEYTYDILEAYFHVKFENVPCRPEKKRGEKELTILDHTFKAKTDLGDEVPIRFKVTGDSVGKITVKDFTKGGYFAIAFGIDPNPRHRQEFDWDDREEEEGKGVTFWNMDDAIWPETRGLTTDEYAKRIGWASGEIGVSFTHRSSSALRKMLNDFCPLKPPNGPTDFKIEASSKTAKKSFDFHKAYLSSISPVFRAKLDDPTSVESKNGTMKLDDFDVETVRILQDLMYKVNSTDFDETSKKFNVEFMMLARKFEIEPFFNACKQKLMDLLEKGKGKSAWKNYVKSSEWKEFAKENPEFSGKVMNLIKPQK